MSLVAKHSVNKKESLGEKEILMFFFLGVFLSLLTVYLLSSIPYSQCVRNVSNCTWFVVHENLHRTTGSGNLADGIGISMRKSKFRKLLVSSSWIRKFIGGYEGTNVLNFFSLSVEFSVNVVCVCVVS